MSGSGGMGLGRDSDWRGHELSEAQNSQQAGEVVGRGVAGAGGRLGRMGSLGLARTASVDMGPLTNGDGEASQNPITLKP